MAVLRTRAVLFATVALSALAISPAAQATDGFENVGAGYFSPSASILGISGDGRVVFGNGFVGYSLGWTFANGAYAWVPLALGHRPDSGKGANISGTLIDAPFSYTAPGLSSAEDWAEAGGGVRLPAWNGAVTASVTASITPNQTTAYVSRLGVVQAF